MKTIIFVLACICFHGYFINVVGDSVVVPSEEKVLNDLEIDEEHVEISPQIDAKDSEDDTKDHTDGKDLRDIKVEKDLNNDHYYDVQDASLDDDSGKKVPNELSSIQGKETTLRDLNGRRSGRRDGRRRR